ncbi:MobB family relaxase [Flavivirga jejuensis]|uniref:MobB family relaxase n=1 Tax=Flavivirga jejuensis TaxID=870487 RepID=A0ABT8WV96_9FLAO|nr:MobB family relaxase [Flavivirga jejuensis]MDO5977118.1 MobB family relaxase [Flavivirga jejuensis]
MYITITKQHSGLNYKGSVGDFVEYLEKENEDKDLEVEEYFFDQYNDRVSPEQVIKGIDENTARLPKKAPKFYSLVISPSPRELKHIGNNPEKLRIYTRELMKDYAASFYRDKRVTVDDIKYYAKLEHTRTFKGTDLQIVENQPYATKIQELKKEIRHIEAGKTKGNLNVLRTKMQKLEAEAPHQQHGKRIVQGMKKDGMQSHIHIIVSRTDASNKLSLSPGSQYKKSETPLNGVKVKRGFNRDEFFKAAEKTFDKTFRFQRNFVESYKAKKMLLNNPKMFFSLLSGLPTSQKQVALSLLHKAGVNVPNIPTNTVQLAFKTFMKLKKGVENAVRSGSIGI